MIVEVRASNEGCVGPTHQMLYTSNKLDWINKRFSSLMSETSLNIFFLPAVADVNNNKCLSCMLIKYVFFNHLHHNLPM